MDKNEISKTEKQPGGDKVQKPPVKRVNGGSKGKNGNPPKNPSNSNNLQTGADAAYAQAYVKDENGGDDKPSYYIVPYSNVSKKISSKAKLLTEVNNFYDHLIEEVTPGVADYSNRMYAIFVGLERFFSVDFTVEFLLRKQKNKEPRRLRYKYFLEDFDTLTVVDTDIAKVVFDEKITSMLNGFDKKNKYHLGFYFWMKHRSNVMVYFNNIGEHITQAKKAVSIQAKYARNYGVEPQENLPYRPGRKDKWADEELEGDKEKSEMNIKIAANKVKADNLLKEGKISDPLKMLTDKQIKFSIKWSKSKSKDAVEHNIVRLLTGYEKTDAGKLLAVYKDYPKETFFNNKQAKNFFRSDLILDKDLNTRAMSFVYFALAERKNVEEGKREKAQKNEQAQRDESRGKGSQNREQKQRNSKRDKGGERSGQADRSQKKRDQMKGLKAD